MSGIITLRTSAELEKLRRAGRIAGEALALGGSLVKAGVTTAQIDKAINQFICSKGAKPSFLGYGGFPASACISVNDEVIHGIPGKRVIQEGDIVSIDVGAYIDGYHGDTAATFPAGEAPPEAVALMDATKQGLMAAIAMAVPGNRLGDVGAAVQEYVEARGYSVVREFVGHGVGRELHEAPEVPNYGRAGHGVRLAAGMVIAIEPMINAGSAAVQVLDNGWTVRTVDRKLAAHFEHTVAITDKGPVLLTQP